MVWLPCGADGEMGTAWQVLAGYQAADRCRWLSCWGSGCARPLPPTPQPEAALSAAGSPPGSEGLPCRAAAGGSHQARTAPRPHRLGPHAAAAGRRIQWGGAAVTPPCCAACPAQAAQQGAAAPEQAGKPHAHFSAPSAHWVAPSIQSSHNCMLAPCSPCSCTAGPPNPPSACCVIHPLSCAHSI